MLFKTILMFGYDLADFGQYVPEDDVFYPSAVLKKDKNYTKENYSLCLHQDTDYQSTIFFIGGFTFRNNESFSNNFMLVPKYEYVQDHKLWLINFYE